MPGFLLMRARSGLGAPSSIARTQYLPSQTQFLSVKRSDSAARGILILRFAYTFGVRHIAARKGLVMEESLCAPAHKRNAEEISYCAKSLQYNYLFSRVHKSLRSKSRQNLPLHVDRPQRSATDAPKNGDLAALEPINFGVIEHSGR